MSLSIRHWLAEHQIESRSLGELPRGQIAGVAFRIVQDMEVKSLTPLDISTLAEVLELPLGVVWQEIRLMSQLTGGLLRSLSQKKPLKRNEGTWLAFQIAYLQAMQQVLEQEFRLKRPWLDRAMIPGGGSEALFRQGNVPLQDAQLQALLKTMRPGRLTDTQAEQALSVGAESFLVQQMNALAIAWFMANGADVPEARLLTQRLVHGLPGHLLVVVAENPLPLAQLQKFVRLGNLTSNVEVHSSASSQARTASDTLTPETELLETPTASASSFITPTIDLHRERYRAILIQALSEPLLEESFALKDLYIPLKGVPIEAESYSQLKPSGRDSTKPVDLMEWATAQLADKKSITLIEAEPGYGKTSFCQIWAAQVAQELYPTWMPVLIRLRDVTLGKTLEQTLNTLSTDEFTSASGWSLPNSPCLLLLDGLDELPPLSQGQSPIATFLEQVVRFQTQNAGASGLPRHKIVIASRPLREWGMGKVSSPEVRDNGQWGMEKNTPYSLAKFRRIMIQPLEQEEFKQWFKQWSKVQSKALAVAYFTFLKQGGVFSRRPEVQKLATLVSQPLMLYLLGVLHRDGRLDDGILEMTNSEVQLEIYDRLTHWLLGYPHEKSGIVPPLVEEGLTHAHRTSEAIANLLQGRRPQDLRHQMQVAALTLLQSARYSSIQLTSESSTGTLPAFYFQSPESKVRSPKSGVRSSESKVRSPEFKVRSPESKVRSPESESKIQNPKSKIFQLNSPTQNWEHIFVQKKFQSSSNCLPKGFLTVTENSPLLLTCQLALPSTFITYWVTASLPLKSKS